MNHFPSDYLMSLDYPPILVHQLWPYGGVCIALFAFVSGYGLFHRARVDVQNPVKTGIRHFLPFYGIYVFLLVVFSLLALFWPSQRLQLPDSASAWLGALGVLLPPYIDWWYASLFLVLCVVCYPLNVWIMRVAGGWSLPTLAACMAGVVLYRHFVHYPLCFHIGHFLSMEASAECAFVQHVTKVLQYLPFFYFGFLSAIILSDERFSSLIQFFLFCCLGSFLIFVNVGMHWDYVCFVVMIVLLVPCLSRLTGRVGYGTLVVLGRYSVWMWLNHRLFIEYYLSDWLYSLPYWLMLSTTVVLSFMLAVLMDYVFRWWSRGCSWLLTVVRLRLNVGHREE